MRTPSGGSASARKRRSLRAHETTDCLAVPAWAAYVGSLNASAIFTGKGDSDVSKSIEATRIARNAMWRTA